MKTVFFNYRGLFVLLAAVFVFSGLPGCEQPKNEKTGSVRDALPNEGDTVLPFRLKTLDGREFAVDGRRGHPLVINFWASWCGPCRSEAAPMEKVYLSFKESGVEFLGVAVQDNESGARKFIDEFKITYPVGVDESGEIMRQYKIFGVPKTFIVGKDGKFSFIFTGAIPEEDLAREIKKAL